MKRFFPTANLRNGFSSLLLATVLLAACTDNGKDKDKDKGKETGGDTSNKDKVTAPTLPADSSLLTIAAIRPSADGKTTEVLFNERAAVYTIPSNSPELTGNNDMLRNAMSQNNPVKVVADAATNAITTFKAPAEAEVKAFNAANRAEPALKGAMLPVALDVTKIDTAKFNRADMIKAPAFALCNNLVPDYNTLVAMFNYCASQGCNNPGPFSIRNCIPFQYVRDGCYARAHKMRQMIMSKYGYCCEKVFSFANTGSDVLAVQAGKWGGCCVQWWYHVAPLLRMNVKIGTATYQICYVIDPGMFNAPVTLATWLLAQKNKLCNVYANVSKYSVQPGSAYWPTNYTGTTFGTDNNYTQTESTLIAYKNLKTCN